MRQKHEKRHVILLDFGLHSTRALPLREIRADLGGYSGGWAGKQLV